MAKVALMGKRMVQWSGEAGIKRLSLREGGRNRETREKERGEEQKTL